MHALRNLSLWQGKRVGAGVLMNYAISTLEGPNFERVGEVAFDQLASYATSKNKKKTPEPRTEQAAVSGTPRADTRQQGGTTVTCPVFVMGSKKTYDLHRIAKLVEALNITHGIAASGTAGNNSFWAAPAHWLLASELLIPDALRTGHSQTYSLDLSLPDCLYKRSAKSQSKTIKTLLSNGDEGAMLLDVYVKLGDVTESKVKRVKANLAKELLGSNTKH
eukprot:jgi/Chrzof1/5227/Cz15g17140.t1